jgi:hypothetical protein
VELREVQPLLWEVSNGRTDARVPARAFADRELIDAIRTDDSLTQLQNVSPAESATTSTAACGCSCCP